MAQIQNLNQKGVALQGFDPLSYFSGEPVEGSADIISNHKGGIYRFQSQENKTKFDANPEQYVPQYGGFCAISISEGRTFPVNPKTYVITDKRLYLFYDGKLGNTKPQWVVDEDNRRANADHHWQNRDFVVIYPTIDY